jgi:hypothetical protein
MMSLIRRIFVLLLASTALVHGVFPTSADTVAAAAITLTKNAAAWTWGAWTQIVAAAGVTAETHIVGFTLENFVGGAAQGEVAIASGGGGAEVEMGRYPIVSATYMLPHPLYVPAATRLSARYRNSNAVADTVDIKLLTETGF